MDRLHLPLILMASVQLGFVNYAAAQNYPSKPIRMLTTEPGGGTDITGRIIAQKLVASLGQPIIVDNRGGASGAIAAGILTNARPDGYTLLYYGGTIWTLPLLRKSVPYDPIRDFAPVSITTSSPYFLYVPTALPASTVMEFISYAKTKPGALNYGASGVGSTPHLAAELFKSMSKTAIQNVPYNSTGAAFNDLMANRVQLVFGSAASGLPNVKAGRLKVLGVASARPSSLAPDVPTVAASGLPDFEVSSMAGLFAPRNTSPALIQRLSEEVLRALNDSEIKARFLGQGIEAVGTSPGQASAIIKADIAKWGKVIKDAGIGEQ